ncbi:dihydropteroate synthase [Nesterenkonia sp. F]|uniref:dihydropteroate synthase n=1 Tax=Nesterenkonia sp. F TaxID=795955 RepID=UPI000255D16C|nr:dihydropteroate synthase [Nesterenkonia sp. F]
MTAAQRTRVMAILNVTPDSFSDGGRFVRTAEGDAGRSAARVGIDHGAAVRRGLALHEAGADIVDVGGESTRPGAELLDPEVEQERILPVVEQLAAAAVPLSIDTRHAATAAAAVDAARRGRRDVGLDGALTPERLVINDVSGLLTETEMPAVVAASGVGVVVMHNRGDAQTMQERADYVDVVAEVRAELAEIIGLHRAAGVADEQIIVDPGVGFAKTEEQNWAVLRALPQLIAESTHPVLLGASRKGFLGTVLADADGTRRPAEGRDVATAALTALAADAGAWAVRVHEVVPNRDAVRVVEALHSR